MTTIGSFAVLCFPVFTLVSACLDIFTYRKMSTDDGTIFVFSEKSLQMWPQAFSLNRQTQAELLNCLRGLIPQVTGNSPCPWTSERLRNSSWKNHVILAHREGSDYSVVSLCQKCHDISNAPSCKANLFQPPSSGVDQGKAALEASWLLLASLSHCSWMLTH